MSDAIQVAAMPKSCWSIRRARRWGSAALIAALATALYYPVLTKLVTDWRLQPDCSYGFLVPGFAAYLAWDRRAAILAARISPAWTGIAVLAAGLLLLLLGVLGAELFLYRISLLLVAAGVVLSLGGAQLLRQLRSVLLVLLLAIPIPSILFNDVAFPLQVLSSKLAGSFLPLCGVPVLREGNILQLAALQLEVEEACSGIRSLMSLFTLFVFYGYFFERSRLRRIALAAASIPVAILANAARIVGTGLCVQYWNPDKAMGFFHEFSGWMIFLVSCLGLLLAHRVLGWLPAAGRKP